MFLRFSSGFPPYFACEKPGFPGPLRLHPNATKASSAIRRFLVSQGVFELMAVAVRCWTPYPAVMFVGAPHWKMFVGL